jgi:hypothetical protein
MGRSLIARAHEILIEGTMTHPSNGQIAPEVRKWQKLLAEHIAVLPVLAGQLKGTAEQMEEAVSALSADLTAIAGDARQHANHMAEALAAFAAAPADAHGAGRELTEQNEKIRRAAFQSMERNAALAQKLCNAVVSLQFQDIVSQRLQHVVQALVEIERSVYRHATELPEGAGTLTGDWAERLNGSYTTAAERKFLAEHTGQLTPDNSGPDSDIELF